MPITQDRLLRILTAAEHYQVLYKTLVGTINREHVKVIKGEQTAQAAETVVWLDAQVVLQEHAAVAIAEERMHYQLTHAKNTLDKGRKHDQRRADGVPVARKPGVLKDRGGRGEFAPLPDLGITDTRSQAQKDADTAWAKREAAKYRAMGIGSPTGAPKAPNAPLEDQWDLNPPQSLMPKAPKE